MGLKAPTRKESPYIARLNGQSVSLIGSAFQTAWLAEVTATPQVIVELGAFDGGDALRLQAAYPDCRVITVEADPARVEIVRNNLKDTAIEVVQAAICDKDGLIDWFSAEIGGETDGQGSIYKHTDFYKKSFPFVTQTDRPGQIAGLRFDSLCAAQNIAEVDLLHIDIEGAEFAALSGLGDIRPKMIYLEMQKKMFESGVTVKATELLLGMLGYELAIDLGTDRLYLHNLAGAAPVQT